jgi:alpha-glucosidase
MPVTTKSRPAVRSPKPPLRERVARDASLIGPGVARFLPPATPRLDPFPAYLVQPQPTGPCPADFPARPRYSRAGSTSVVRVDCPTGASFYGTGEQAGPLKRNGTRKVLWNTDAFDYTDRSPSLYQAHPFVLVLLPDGSAMGIIAETTRRCEVDLRKDVTFRVKGPAPAITIIKRDHPREVVRELARLTGYMPLPPRWALGYHQCRWSYEPESRVIEIAQGFRDRSIPCDVIWLDIDYMNGFRCFTFDAEKFPDPKAMNAKLHSMGFRSIYMIDPGIKVDDQYSVYAQGRDGDHFVKNAAGREYHGKVWPGMCAFPDFTRARTRAWWASLYKDFLAQGIDGVWNDMNEPAVFDVPGKTMPDSNHHDADPDLGGPGSHATFHNVYGMLMVRASREGMAAARPDRRPFILTRANFLGGQRYAATWTGDNRSDWHHLRWSIATTINLGLSGQPLSGPDIGGFVGDASPELFARFMGIAALLPFTRAHSIKDSTDHEPWSFGPHTEQLCRLALLRRYRLLPYLYTLAHHASVTGDPIVRPLFYADPTDVRLRAADSSFLLGDDLLVRCSTAKNSFECPDPMPRGDWREITLVGEAAEHALPRLFLRAGAAIPLAPASMTTDDAARAELTLLAAPDASGEARATHYHDAGDGYAHEKGDRRITRYLVKNGLAQIEYFDGPESPAGLLPKVKTV